MINYPKLRGLKQQLFIISYNSVEIYAQLGSSASIGVTHLVHSAGGSRKVQSGFTHVWPLSDPPCSLSVWLAGASLQRGGHRESDLLSSASPEMTRAEAVRPLKG